MFETKGGTLARLKPLLTLGRCPEQIIIDVAEWRRNREGSLDAIHSRFGDAPLAVRSSADFEDGHESSYAGALDSQINVAPTDTAITAAFNTVISSYGAQADTQEVLVQSMVRDVALSGVVLTRDLDTGSPYFIVNYDDVSGRTDTVTGGADSHTILIYRHHPQSIQSSRFRRLIDSVLEIETLTESSELDIEFCITRDEAPYILQVRPLAARQNWQAVADAQIATAITRTFSAIGNMAAPSAGVVGNSTILCEMSDWNPAEMIGSTPRPLALSLYKRLITDRVWSDARSAMGYRSVPRPLLVDFHGRPYIDVRLSLNSFLPSGLNDTLAESLVDHQLAMLAERPGLHDKIEFEISVTCRDFSFTKQRSRLEESVLDASGLENFSRLLQVLTAKALAQRGEGITRLLEHPRQLLEHPRQLLEAKSDDQPPLDRVGRLLDECTVKGTLPFSMLARHAFIGISFLKSLNDRGVFSTEDLEVFMRSIHTIVTDFVTDMVRLNSGGMDQEAFLKQYGHLRPGTYDIMSFRYDSHPGLYLGNGGNINKMQSDRFELDVTQEKAIRALLDESGYELTPSELLEYVRQAVQAREEAKFAFTRNISDALHILAHWGEEHGYSREDLSYLPIETLLEKPDHGVLRERIEEGRENFRLTRAIRLPHLISEPEDVHVVRLPLGQPTFITSGNVTAPIVELGSVKTGDIEGRIILIKSADPGFDWIFTHPIMGLITLYGGANSHMAIRCAELGLPAAIGCGERMFHNLTLATTIELNCAERKISAH